MEKMGGASYWLMKRSESLRLKGVRPYGFLSVIWMGGLRVAGFSRQLNLFFDRIRRIQMFIEKQIKIKYTTPSGSY